MFISQAWREIESGGSYICKLTTHSRVVLVDPDLKQVAKLLERLRVYAVIRLTRSGNAQELSLSPIPFYFTFVDKIN